MLLYQNIVLVSFGCGSGCRLYIYTVERSMTLSQHSQHTVREDQNLRDCVRLCVV